MAVNRRLLKERLNLNPGLKQKTKPARQSHLKLFSKDSQPGIRSAGAADCEGACSFLRINVGRNLVTLERAHAGRMVERVYELLLKESAA